ncbi:hypothetical protein C2S52_017496 [Perilla frutescens var. hirtella]|nr:hypothetical protein C2S52_017496 [Perilla frutescens var. hirtella]KAH6811277.1 hypothetical protein C2S51_025039 [Perilla frutescens var. frutescens]
MTNVDDDLRSLMALEHGAYLCIKKPMTMTMLGCLWQFVLREKDVQLKEARAFAELMGYYKSQEREYLGNFVVESSSNNHHNNILNIQHDLEANAKQKSSEQEQHNINDDGGSGSSRFHSRRKDWLEWTVELHHKFMAAAKQLGQGKCYPKDILEIMDVPGLSRMQVASHLQNLKKNGNYIYVEMPQRKMATSKREKIKGRGDSTKKRKESSEGKNTEIRFNA